jgi:Tfp pilus assembly protein PilN
MSQVNLLPAEIRQRQQTRRLTTAVIAGGAFLVLAMIFFYLLQVNSLSNVERQIAKQEADNARVQREIDALQRFQQLQDEAQAKKAILQLAFANEVSFSGLLLDLSRIIPSDAYLTTLAVQVNATPAEGTQTEARIVGQITLAGQGANLSSVATLITRLENVSGWANPFVSTVQRPGENQIVVFTGTVDLTPGVLTKRGAAGAGVA